MPRRIPPQFQPGPLSRAQVDALNQLSRDFYSLFGGFTAAPPLEVSQSLDGVNYRMGPVTASSTLSVGEVDLSPLFTADTILFNQANGFVVSTPSAGVAQIDFTGGGIEVKEVDGVPDILAVTVLSFDQAAGFVVSSPGAGQAQIGLLDASPTQKGVVNLITQHFAGFKVFDNDAQANFAFHALSFQLSSSQYLTTLELVTGSGTFGVGIYDGAVAFGASARLVLMSGGVGVAATSGGSGANASYSVVNSAGAIKTGLYVGTRGNGDVYSGGLLTTNGAVGFTGTAILAKLTTTGANGSLTFANGWCTAYVAPT